ncbi:MAG: reprolysin-like metallopeptidase [Candidatus Paceibacterota bacterium]
MNNPHRTSPPEEDSSDQEFPDQELFEPDPNLEALPPSIWRQLWPFARFVVAGLVVAGLVYLSGTYQALLLRETPETIRQEALESRIDAEVLTVPVEVFLLTSESSTFGTKRDRENAARIVQNASNIWSQAGIELVLGEIRTIEVGEEDIDRFTRDPHGYVRSISGHGAERIGVFLTGTLSGLNGVAFGGTGSLVVADVVSHYDFRTLAHEIGHVFGLAHTGSGRRLMSQGAYGTTLTLDEIAEARSRAEAFVR